MENICPLCKQRISMLSMAEGRCVFTIEGVLVHLWCANGLSIEEVSKRVKDGLDRSANWSVAFLDNTKSS